MNIREFIAHSRADGILAEVERPLDLRFELARVLAAFGDRPVLLHSLVGFPDWQVVAGVCGRREHFAAALRCTVPEVRDRMVEAAAHPTPPPVLDSGPCREVEAAVDLTRLPIPRYHPLDGGRYVTAGVAVVNDPQVGRNVAFHRLLVLDERHFAARLVEGRGTHTAWERAGKNLPVAIAIGNPLHVLLAAAMSPPPGVDEFGIANALTPFSLVRCEHGLAVPAEAELVLEGRITGRLADEGPFPDLTGTLDRVRRQPVIEIERITHRRNPFFHALLPGGPEHKNLMGMPREPTIFAAVNEVCRCTGVYITPGGGSWLHAVVQIEKRGPEDGHLAIEAAFRGHSSLKHVVVVDDDVNIYDAGDVEWAIATRFQADRDLFIFPDRPGSSLDPSARQVPGQKSRTAKMGLDATAPLGAARQGYERIRYE